MNKSINISAFLERFRSVYSFLYNHRDTYPGHDFNTAMQAFDALAERQPDFIAEFCRYRKDFISSDREAAAFMIALYEMS